MASGLCVYTIHKLLDLTFGAQSWSPPATIFFGLSTTEITDSGSGITEPSGGGYARKSMSNNKTTWSNAASKSLNNAVAIEFAEATGNWGTITHVFIADASTNGNILAFGALTASKDINTGDVARFLATKLVITINTTP